MTKQIIFIFALLCTLQAQASVQPVQKDTVRHTIHYEVAELLQSCTKRVQTAIIIYRISASGYIVVVKDMAICIE
jgi:hypothetical protein